MATAKVQGTNTKGYVIETESEGHQYTLDYASRNPNKESAGTSPTGLLLSSLAGCLLMTARSYLDRSKIEAKTLDTEVTGDFKQSLDGWDLEVDAVITTDADLDEQHTKNLKQFIDRFCTVSAVLRNGNTINLSIEKV
jgi:uncharacterized OsmC-like protein